MIYLFDNYYVCIYTYYMYPPVGEKKPFKVYPTERYTEFQYR